ncbi:MAG: hypothetical protein OER92_10530, partial [Alphaproteobacteria bacterium]|nr:hypothetical protein [Alphaproteobacteria bacterium]
RAPAGRLSHADTLAEALTTARTSADQRIAGERAAAELAARTLRFHAAGYVTIDRADLATASPDIAERVVVRTLMAVAGRGYPPRGLRLRRLCEALLSGDAFTGRTLAGCRLIGQQNWVHVCREAARVGPPLTLTTGVTEVWDSRFSVLVTNILGDQVRLDALAAAGWQQIVAADPNLRETALPYASRTVLPAIWRGDDVISVPHLGYVNSVKPAVIAGLRLKWSPPQAVAPAPFGRV